MSQENRGKFAAAKGAANESRFLAALLGRNYNASLVDSPLSTYDIVVEMDKHDIIRVQVKTVSPEGSISFKGGVRGGSDRAYKSGVKEYTQSTETSDIIVGVESVQDNGDIEINFYFIPTLYVERLNQKSLSINKIPQAKNEWEILKNCKDEEFVRNFFK